MMWMVLVMQVIQGAVPPDEGDKERYWQKVKEAIDWINARRRHEGYPELTVSVELCRDARREAEYQEKYDYAGYSPWPDRGWYESQYKGYSYRAVVPTHEYNIQEFKNQMPYWGDNLIKDGGVMCSRDPMTGKDLYFNPKEIGVGMAWEPTPSGDMVIDGPNWVVEFGYGDTDPNNREVLLKCGTVGEDKEAAYPPFSLDDLPKHIAYVAGNSWDGYTYDYTAWYKAMRDHQVYLYRAKKKVKVGEIFRLNIKANAPLKMVKLKKEKGKKLKGVKLLKRKGQLKGRPREKGNYKMRSIGYYRDLNGNLCLTPPSKVKIIVK